MKVLIVNDDGITAPGIALLERLVSRITTDIWVVAPDGDRSGASRSVTLADPVRLRYIDDRHVAVSGTPTDCLVLGINQVLDGAPNLVICGINQGANVAEDVYYSGTCAVAMEAAVTGIPAIALSQDFARGDTVWWSTAERFAMPLVECLGAVSQPAQAFWNVNFPAVPPEAVAGVRLTRQGTRDLAPFEIHRRQDPSEREYFWLKYSRHSGSEEDGTDLRALTQRTVSISSVPLRFTTTEDYPDVAEALRAIDGTVAGEAIA